MTVNKPPDAALYNVLSVILDRGGRYDQGDPGEVLYNLADDAAIDYFTTAHSIAYFESMGWVRVDRLYHSAPARGNRIVAIEIIEEES